MNEDKAREAQEREEMRAWHETKAACDPSDWSTAESAAYRGFFVHGFRAALQWAASQQAAEGDLHRDADRWRQLAHMEASMAAPETLAHYIARPDRLDFIAKLRAEPVAAPPSAQGGADEQR